MPSCSSCAALVGKGGDQAPHDGLRLIARTREAGGRLGVGMLYFRCNVCLCEFRCDTLVAPGHAAWSVFCTAEDAAARSSDDELAR